jgi:hypothetical protein
MDGLNNISLNGLLNIGSTATYDNGGESQIINSGGSVNISGKFINRDKDNFTGTNGAIPGIVPTLNAGCTVEYGLSGNQVITARNDYQNITFSGSGTKTPSNTFTPLGTLYITGAAIVDAGSHNIGDGVTLTGFTMDGGRLISGTTGTQPMMAGSYNLTAGIVQFNGGGAQTIRSKTYQNIEVTGAGVGNSNGNITLNTSGTFVVKNGGIFVINDNNITGAGATQTVTVENGGVFRCGNNEGFNGFAATFTSNSSIGSTITNINLHTGSTVEYIRGGDQPITNANGLIYSNLLISGTGSKTAPSGILDIRGNLTKSGTSNFAHNNGAVLLDGTTQTFAGLTYNNLLLTNGTKTTSGSSTIIDSIKINDGTTLSIRGTPDTVTLHSDASKTARIGQIGTGTINYNSKGKFVVERYIPARKAWRFLAVPITSLTQTIKDAWQEGGTFGPSVSGYGTQITGPQGTAAGFDLYSALPSLKTYNKSTDNYDGVTSTTVPLDGALGGYMFFIRGDRNTIYNNVTSTTLRTAGQLNAYAQTPITINNQFTPINNPYASQIDLVHLSTVPAYYVWDPNRGGTNGYGGFTTFAWNGSSFDVSPGNIGSYGTNNSLIDNGQAFFASTIGPPIPIQFAENVKTSSALTISPFTPVTEPGQQLRSDVYVADITGVYYIADGILNTYSDNYSNGVDAMDAKKNLNPTENLSIRRDNILLAIERRQSLRTQDTIFFHLSNFSAKKACRFVFTPNKIIESGLQPWLEDDYLRTKSALHVNDTTQVNFITDGSTGSAAPNRFRIVFDAAGVALPITFTNVKAYPKNKDIAVEWTVDNETGIQNYQVLQSPDGARFTPAAVIIANNLPVNSSYSWLDRQPAAGYHCFRIAGVDINGQVKYSNIVKVVAGDNKSGISVYPNPVCNGIIHLQLNNQPAGKYGIRLINKAGQVICSKEIQHAGNGSRAGTMQPESNTAHGVYRLEVTKPDGTVKDLNVVY